MGLVRDPLSIDPRFVADAEGAIVVGALFEPLVRIDVDGEVVPGAASTWEVSPDGTRFTFTLRPATFHDGSPVTAADFRRSFDRLVDGTATPRSYLGYLLEPVRGSRQTAGRGEPLAGLEVVDERTLVIETSEPRPGFLLTLADPSLVPLPPQADEDLDVFAAQPIGNGPFAMAEPRDPGRFLRLTGVADHHRAPAIDEVVLVVYPDDPTGERQWEDLLEGQLQVAALGPELRAEARARFGSSPDGYTGPGVLDGLTSELYLYGFNTTTPPFDDPRVRRAVSLAIDREALAEEVMLGLREPARALVPPPVRFSQPRACDHCRYDPEAARALLAEVDGERLEAAVEAAQAEAEAAAAEADAAEDPDGSDGAVLTEPDDPAADPEADDATGDDPDAGDPGPDDEPAPPVVEVEPVLTTLTLTHSRGRTHTALAERMVADLEAALDIRVTRVARDLGPLLSSVQAGEVALFRFGWQTHEPSFAAYLDPLFHSRELGRENLTRYADDEVDALLDDARTSLDPRVSRQRYRQAERRILADAPVLPLLWYRHWWVVADDVEGFRMSAFGRVDLAAVERRSD